MPVQLSEILAHSTRMASFDLGTAVAAHRDAMNAYYGPRLLVYTNAIVAETTASGGSVVGAPDVLGGSGTLSFAWKTVGETEQNAGGRVDINSSTGAITRSATGTVSFDDGIYAVIVVVTDENGKSHEHDLDIEVAAPIDSLLSEGGATLENAANGSLIERLTVQGGQPPYTAQFVATEGDAGGRVSVADGPGDRLDILVADTDSIVFASATSHDYKLEITDSLGQVASFVRTFQVLQVGTDPEGYSTSPVLFDGNTYLESGADLTGIVDGKTGFLVLPIRLNSVGSQQMILCNVVEGTVRFDVRYQNNVIFVQGRNSAGTQILFLQSSIEFTDASSTHLVAVAWDMDTQANNKLFVDHVDRTALGVFVQGGTIAYSGDNWYVGAYPNGGAKLSADIAFIGLALNQWLDVSNATVQGRILTTEGRYVDPGADGSNWAATATAVDILLGAPGSTTSTWPNNGGSGGDFTIVAGVLVSSAVSFPGTDQAEDPPPPPSGATYEPDVVLEPGDNLVSIVNSNPAGTAYGVKKGLYSPGTLASHSGNFCRLPLKSGDTVRGIDTEIEPGVWTLADPDDVVFIGAVKLSNWQNASSGGLDYHDHPGLPAKLSFLNSTSTAITEVMEREDLFVCPAGTNLLTTDPVMWRRTQLRSNRRLADPLSDSETGFRGWVRNSNTARIRQGRDFNPSNHDAYLGVIGDFIPRTSANNTTISNLTFKMFASNPSTGAIGAGLSSSQLGSGHTLENVKGRLCHAAAVRAGVDETHADCEFKRCGQYSVNFNSGRRYRAVGCAFSFGRELDYVRSWDTANAKGGGTVAGTDWDILFELCLFEGGRGDGVWFDGNHTGTVDRCCFYYVEHNGVHIEFITSQSDNIATPPVLVRDCIVWPGLEPSGQIGRSMTLSRAKRARIQNCLVIAYGGKGGVDCRVTNLSGIGSSGTVEDMQVLDCDIWHATDSGSIGRTGYQIGSGLPPSLITDCLYSGNTFHIPTGDSQSHAARATSSGQVNSTFASAISASATSQGQFDNTNSVQTHSSFNADRLAAFQARYDALVADGMPRVTDPQDGLAA